MANKEPKSLDGVLIKKPHRIDTYTDAQALQVQKCLDPVNGYKYFMENFFFIQHPVKGKLRFEPYDYQMRLLEAYHNHTFTVALLSRQSGKTTCSAGYLLWYAMFKPDQTILISAHKYQGALEIMLRVRYAYEMCPDFIKAGATSYNKGSLEFDNGSRIVSTTTTETTGRGMSISLLYLDEFGFCPANIAANFWASISPTLTTGGRAIITSTPNSDEDQFAQIWQDANKTFDSHGNKTELGINGFFAFRADWWEHPDRDDAWRRMEEGRLGAERFGREFELKFLVFEETLISSIKISEMKGIEPIMKTGQCRWYKKPKADMIYIISLDPSLGTGGNNAAIQVFEMPTMTQVAEWCHNITPIEGQIKIVQDIAKYIYECTPSNNAGNIYWSVENNNVGEAALVTIRNLGEDRIPGLLISEPIKKGHVRKFRKGFTTTHKTKITACARLKHMVETGVMKINSPALISELKSFIASGISFKAKTGSNDDLVLATLLMLRICSVLADWDPRVFDVMTGAADKEDMDNEWIAPMPIYVTSGY